jgi:hypothetical protein
LELSELLEPLELSEPLEPLESSESSESSESLELWGCGCFSVFAAGEEVDPAVDGGRAGVEVGDPVGPGAEIGFGIGVTAVEGVGWIFGVLRGDGVAAGAGRAEP